MEKLKILFWIIVGAGLTYYIFVNSESEEKIKTTTQKIKVAPLKKAPKMKNPSDQKTVAKKKEKFNINGKSLDEIIEKKRIIIPLDSAEEAREIISLLESDSRFNTYTKATVMNISKEGTTTTYKYMDNFKNFDYKENYILIRDYDALSTHKLGRDVYLYSQAERNNPEKWEMYDDILIISPRRFKILLKK